MGKTMTMNAKAAKGMIVKALDNTAVKAVKLSADKTSGRHYKLISLYTYDELSEKAKQKAYNDYMGCDSDIFYDMCIDRLHDLLPNSELDVQFSLSYCQGDGLNIYGSLDLSDMLAILEGNFTEKECKFLKWIISYSSDVTMPENQHYCYCICDRVDYTEDIVYNVEDNHMRGIKYDILKKFNGLCSEYLCKLCSGMEEDGYDFFHPFPSV